MTKHLNLLLAISCAAAMAACSGTAADNKDNAPPEKDAPAVEAPAEAPPANKFAAEAAASINEDNADAEADKLEKELMAEIDE